MNCLVWEPILSDPLIQSGRTTEILYFVLFVIHINNYINSPAKLLLNCRSQEVQMCFGNLIAKPAPHTSACVQCSSQRCSKILCEMYMYVFVSECLIV